MSSLIFFKFERGIIMSKFKIGDLVQIDNMLRDYHMCIGKIVAFIEVDSPKRTIYEVGGVEGCFYPIRVSEENLVLVSSGYGSSRQLVEYAKADAEHTRNLYSAITKLKGCDDNLVPKIENVILNDPAVIIMWGDGTKTVVKAQGEKFDPEKGLAMAISKKAFGNKHSYYGVFLKNIPGLKKKGAK